MGVQIVLYSRGNDNGFVIAFSWMDANDSEPPVIPGG
jgi:hypothetical protein